MELMNYKRENNKPDVFFYKGLEKLKIKLNLLIKKTVHLKN